MNNQKDKNQNIDHQDINHYRENIIKYLIERIHFIQTSNHQVRQYKIALKKWCITLFMGSIGFCLMVDFKDEFIKSVSWLMPFTPVIIFWFHNAYQEYLVNYYKYAKERDLIEQTICELYNTDSMDELKERGKSAIEFQSKNNQDNPRKRGVKKIIEIFFKCKGDNVTFWSFENVFFFGSLFLVWFIIFLKRIY